MRVVRRHLFLLPICGGSAQVQFACEQTSRRSQTRIVSLNRERGELESGATAALRQGAFVGTGLVRRLGQMDEQERGERGLFCAHWATCRACPTLALDSPGNFARAAVDAARSKRKRWASHRNLVPASEAELRAATMPDLLPHAGATAWPGPPSQPGAAARLDEFRRALGGRSVRIGDLWEPAEWERFQRWMQRARRGVYQPPARFPQSSLVPLARGYVWDTRDPQDCRPMEPSDIDTPFPGRRQIDRRAFRRLARELLGASTRTSSARSAAAASSRARGASSPPSCTRTRPASLIHVPGRRPRPSTRSSARTGRSAPSTSRPAVPSRALPRDVIMNCVRDARTPDQGGQTRNEHPYVYGFRQLGFVNRVYCARFVAG